MRAPLALGADLDEEDLLEGEALPRGGRVALVLRCVHPDERGRKRRQMVALEYVRRNRILDCFKDACAEHSLGRMVEPLRGDAPRLGVDGEEGGRARVPPRKERAVVGERRDALDFWIREVDFLALSRDFPGELRGRALVEHLREVRLVEPHHFD